MKTRRVQRGDHVICTSVGVYGESLTRGKRYRVLLRDAAEGKLYLQGDDERKWWFPADCFQRPEEARVPLLDEYSLDAPPQNPDNDCVEVRLRLSNGQRRWCFFTTPRWISDHFRLQTEPRVIEAGNLRLGQITFLAEFLQTSDGKPFGVINMPNLVIVSRITSQTIDRTLRHLDAQGLLEASSLPFEESERRPPGQPG